MVQKVIEIVGISKKGFDDAAKNALETAAKSVRNIQWARASEFECKCADGKIVDYRALSSVGVSPAPPYRSISFR